MKLKSTTTETQAAQYRRQYRLKRLAQGLCPRCGKPVVPGKAACTDCLKQYRSLAPEIQRKRRARRKALGFCTRCDTPATPNRSLCSKHLAIQRATTKRLKDKDPEYRSRQAALSKEWSQNNRDHVNAHRRRHRRLKSNFRIQLTEGFCGRKRSKKVVLSILKSTPRIIPSRKNANEKLRTILIALERQYTINQYTSGRATGAGSPTWLPTPIEIREMAKKLRESRIDPERPNSMSETRLPRIYSLTGTD